MLEAAKFSSYQRRGQLLLAEFSSKDDFFPERAGFLFESSERVI